MKKEITVTIKNDRYASYYHFYQAFPQIMQR